MCDLKKVNFQFCIRMIPYVFFFFFFFLKLPTLFQYEKFGSSIKDGFYYFQIAIFKPKKSNDKLRKNQIEIFTVAPVIPRSLCESCGNVSLHLAAILKFSNSDSVISRCIVYRLFAEKIFKNEPLIRSIG